MTAAHEDIEKTHRPLREELPQSWSEASACHDARRRERLAVAVKSV